MSEKQEAKTEGIQMDASYTSKSELTTYHAAKHHSAVRAEVVGCFDTYFFVNEAKQNFQIKWNESTMLAMRHVLNQWYSDKIERRGK